MREFVLQNISKANILCLSASLTLYVCVFDEQLEQFKDARLCIKEARNFCAFHPDSFFQVLPRTLSCFVGLTTKGLSVYRRD